MKNNDKNLLHPSEMKVERKILLLKFNGVEKLQFFAKNFLLNSTVFNAHTHFLTALSYARYS